MAARVKAVLRRFDWTPAPASAPAHIEPKAKEEPVETAVVESTEGVYEGTVRLAVSTAGCIRRMIHFVDELRQNSQFHLLRLVASQHSEGMDILLRLREPIRLKPALLQMEDVSEVEDSTQPESDEQLLHVSLGA